MPHSMNDDDWEVYARNFHGWPNERRRKTYERMIPEDQVRFMEAWERLGYLRKDALPKPKAGLPPLLGVLPGLAMAVFGLATLIPAHGITSPQAAWGASILGLGVVMIGPLWRACAGAIPKTPRAVLRASLLMALFVGFTAGMNAENRLARSQGWVDYSAKSEASSLGLSTPAEYKAHQDREAKAERSRSTAASKPSVDATCRRDLQCWGEKYIIEADVYCQDSIERLAQYTHEWTDGFLDNKFSRWGWKDQRAGHLTYFGDKLKFQNGFGAWQQMVYQCDFDPSNNRVIAVNAEPGRLPAQ